MTREQILKHVKRMAEANGNVPVGERAFFADARLTRRALWRAGFPNYGSAVEAAGYQRNELKQAFSDAELFPPLARLTRALEHFPTDAERIIARHQDSTFPGLGAYRRRAASEPLAQALLHWCQSNGDFQDVAELLRVSSVGKTESSSPRDGRKVVTGYVYLMRYGTRGNDYKVGRTDNVARRESQLDMMSPSDVRIIHSIETDDPEGIEKYWHSRFAERRIKTKEVFRLTSDDVAAFKRRRYQ